MTPTLRPESLKLIRAVPQLSAFEGVDELFESLPVVLSELAIISYETLVPEEERIDSHAVEAAIYVATIGTFLIDDVMDHDEDKPTAGLSEERRINLGCALMIAGSQLMNDCAFPEPIKAELHKEYSTWLLDAAVGQEVEERSKDRDVTDEDMEARYWDALRGKCGQQLSRMLNFGTIMAQRDDVREQFLELGLLIGEMAQLFDDMADASEISPDWESPRKNLMILFCHHPRNPKRDEFIEQFAKARTDTDAFLQCRNIMIETGAIGYGIYHFMDRYRKAREIINQMSDLNADPFDRVLARMAGKIINSLKELGIPLPEDLVNAPMPEDWD